MVVFLGKCMYLLIMLWNINECIGDSDNSIDLSHDGWVSVNDILIEESLQL